MKSFSKFLGEEKSLSQTKKAFDDALKKTDGEPIDVAHVARKLASDFPHDHLIRVVDDWSKDKKYKIHLDKNDLVGDDFPATKANSDNWRSFK